jgi:hypothetical protein
LDRAAKIRLMAFLWLAAAALACLAAVISYTKTGEVRAAYLAAAVFLAAMGFGVLRRSKNAGV